MPRPKNPKMRGVPPPKTFEPSIGRKIRVPHSDIPSVGGRPIVRITTSPPLWMPDTEWTGRWLRQTDKPLER